jgi:chitin disaccharide deacetylase
MPDESFLIVNADDFGQGPGINEGIARAHRHGIVTSASLMVRWPAAEGAAAYGREHPEMSLGLHVDLGEWTYRDGRWSTLYEVVPTDDKDAVADEVERQAERFRDLAGRDPTHLDSHQHVHRSEPVRSLLLEVGRRLGVPVRLFDPDVRYSGRFYGQTGKGEPLPGAVSVEALVEILGSLPHGITELGCHPGVPDGELRSMYAAERAEELETLTSDRVREPLRAAGVRLCSFHDVAAIRARGPVASDPLER